MCLEADIKFDFCFVMLRTCIGCLGSFEKLDIDNFEYLLIIDVTGVWKLLDGNSFPLE